MRRIFIDNHDRILYYSNPAGYAEPEEDPIGEGEAADPTAEMPESEVTG